MELEDPFDECARDRNDIMITKVLPPRCMALSIPQLSALKLALTSLARSKLQTALHDLQIVLNIDRETAGILSQAGGKVLYTQTQHNTK